MPNLNILWDEDADPEGNIQHIAEHGLTIDEVEYVLFNPESEAVSASTGLPLVFGYTSNGEYIAVVFERIDKTTVYPITAYEVPEPK